jgi:hypothetical protein
VIILDPSIKGKVSISLNTKLFSIRFVDDEICEMLGRKITTDDLMIFLKT